MWHPNDVIRSVLLPHIHFNRNTRPTLQWPARSMDLNLSICGTYWSAMCVSSRCNLISESSRLLLIRCVILQQFLHRYILSWGTMYIAVTATSGGHTMYWKFETKLNTTYIDIAVFGFRVSMLILSGMCVPMIFQWNFVLHFSNELY